MVERYRKKPVVIEALQWDGENIGAICSFVDRCKYVDGCLYIYTLEGVMQASVGDYIVKGVDGEFYPCKPGIFEKTYELANTAADVAPVVFCKDCHAHTRCLAERVYKSEKIEKPFCCRGRKDGESNG